VKRNFAKLPGPAWLGANFWSRTGGPLMWRSYDPGVVRAELDVLRDHGLNLTRSFFYWPDFMPEPDRVDETLAGHYADFLEAHAERGMRTVPTFIVGHMSGENWDPAWRQGRDLYADVWMVDRQAWFAEEMTRRFTGHPAIAAWLITNEMPIYGGVAETSTVTAWARLMVAAVRAGGGREPVAIGDGAWGIEVTGRDNGFSVRDLAAITDFVGPHSYPMQDDQVRQHYEAAFMCELSGSFDRPVVLEEFGCSSDFVADDLAAHYYRQVLHNSLLAGATGWVAWNNTDFDLVDQPPYSHHPFELHFGLTLADGTPKPALEEMRRFGRTLADLDLARCERADTDTAFVVPAVMEAGFPFTETADRSHVFESLRQAYVTARATDLAPALTRETDGIAGDGRLYLVPSAKQLTAPGWHRLEDLAEAGATIYVSYCAGPHRNQRGPWYSHLNAMFGVEHRLRYGLADPIEDDVVELTFTTDFGGLAAGTTLTFRTAGTENSRAYLPVRPVTAEVVAEDAHGRPALLSRRHGEGRLVLCTYPLEHMAALTPRVNPEATHRLYDALATLAGVRRPVTAADPRVSADLLVRDDGTRFAVIVSQADVPLKVTPVVADAEPVAEEVALEPYGVVVLELRP
jgi:endo-1,4-beta-mannosidase